MKKINLIVGFVLISSIFYAQKLYTWCPKEQISTPRPGFLENDSIDLIIFDGRIITPDTKVECTSENTIYLLAKFIQETYPSAKWKVLAASNYFKEPQRKRITIKIGISAYHAAFGADVKIGIGSLGGNFSYGVFPEGKWNAVTGYAVKLFDLRQNKDVKQTKDIYKTASKSNLGGYISAKNILNTTYIEANQELLFFIDEVLM